MGINYHSLDDMCCWTTSEIQYVPLGFRHVLLDLYGHVQSIISNLLHYI